MSTPKDVYTFADLQNWTAATAGVDPPLRLAVFGDPVAHSLSPPMHNAALEKAGLPLRYCRLHIHPEELAGAVAALPGAGFAGVNVTIPHKAAMLPLMDEVDDLARRIGAVNTVLVEEDGRRTGFNTDGPGLVKAVRAEFSVDLRDLRVMILGAGGGAGRAIAVQCGLEGCERLVLVNRTVSKAQELAAELAPFFAGPKLLGPVARLEAIPWEERAVQSQVLNTDLIINATPMGLKRTDSSPLPPALLRPHLMVLDTVYGRGKTKLMLAAEEAGARAASGLSMLLYQGAFSFEIWFNREAPVEEMRRALAGA
jgi:shikimate dehydrogenase